jgi:hypothetical protein
MADLEKLFRHPDAKCTFDTHWLNDLTTAAWTAPTVPLGKSAVAYAHLGNTRHTILFIGTPFKTPYVLYKTEVTSPFSGDIAKCELLHHIPAELMVMLRDIDRSAGLVVQTGALTVLNIINAYEIQKIHIALNPSLLDHQNGISS